MALSGARQRSLWILCAAIAGAQVLIGVEAPTLALAQTAAKVSSQQLDSLTAPIALYPDALLAQVLMAATFPQDVQSAAAWSHSNPNVTGDAAVKAVASQPWDPSVQSLVAFPQVLATMASKPDWIQQLGNAFLAQPNDVMDSVQRLRKQAQQAGNLKSSEQQKVVVEQNTIQIVPTSPQVIYVPTYNPTVVYGTWPYPAYPPVYVPPPPGYAIATGFAAGLAFGAGIAVTNALWGGFNWGSHDVNVNVNRYNNINVNNRINANGGTTNWNRNTANVNRNTANINRSNLSGEQRNNFRGYDSSRQQAAQTLQNRTGQNMSGNASQRFQNIQQGGGPNNEPRNRANNVGEQGNRTNNASEPRNRTNNASEQRSRTNAAGEQRNRTGNANDLRNSANNANRDNALRGAGDGNAARQDTQRGQQSRQAFNNRQGGGMNAGGTRQMSGGPGAGGRARQGGGGGFGGGGGGGRHFGR